MFRRVAQVLVRLVRARRPLGLNRKELLLGLHDLARGRIRFDMYALISKAWPRNVDDLLEQRHDPRRRDPVRLAQHPREVVLHEPLPYPRGHQHVPFDQEHEVRPCLLDGEIAKGIDGKQRLYNRGENIGQHIGQQSLVMIVLSLPHHAHLHSSHTSTRFQLNGSPPFPSLPWPGPPPRHEGRHAS